MSDKTDLAKQLGQLAELHQQGALSDDEFKAAKTRLLAQPKAEASPKRQAPRVDSTQPITMTELTALLKKLAESRKNFELTKEEYEEEVAHLKARPIRTFVTTANKHPQKEYDDQYAVDPYDEDEEVVAFRAQQTAQRTAIVMIVVSVVVMAIFLCCCYGGLDGISGSSSNSRVSRPAKSTEVTRPSPVKKWFIGGNLHQKTFSDWRRATDANKLATAADMVMQVPLIKREVEVSGDFDKLRPYAMELVICLNEASAGGETEEFPVAEGAAACMILMGWI